MAAPQDALKNWTAGEREKWKSYPDSIQKYVTVKKLLSSIPTESKFLEDAAAIIGLQGGAQVINQLAPLFFEKPTIFPSVKSDVGKTWIKEGAKEYPSRLKANGYKLSQQAEKQLTEYLVKVASDAAKLFDQPWSNQPTRGGNYRIVNGNKYLKLLRFIDTVRADNREELKKYYNLQGEFTAITSTAYGDPYAFFRLGKVTRELYCFANLERPDVHIHNTKTDEIKDLYGKDVNVENFADLFTFFSDFEAFVKSKYNTTWLDTQPDFRKMVNSGLSEEQTTIVLQHLEQDQLSQYFHELNEPAKGKGEVEAKPKVVEGGPPAFSNPLNLILYGPPGTGKTYATKAVVTALELGSDVRGILALAEDLADFLDSNPTVFDQIKVEDRVKIVTFHPSYAYEDFVEGIRAESDGKIVTYPPKDGVFKIACKLAEDNKAKAEGKPKNVYLVIDEINRGNISKIFGELVTLIEEDKRSWSGGEWSAELPYTQKPFSVPPNLYVIGTMNTADRSIALLDVALRRRFEFFEMLPLPSLLDKEVSPGINLKVLLSRINGRIVLLGERDKQIGHAYFMPKGAPVQTPDELKRIWFGKIIPLLNEYFYGRWEDIAFVLGGKPPNQNGGEAPFLKVVNKEEGIYDFKTEVDVDKFEDELKKTLA